MHQWAQDTLFLGPLPLPERWKSRNHPALVWSRSENPARVATVLQGSSPEIGAHRSRQLLAVERLPKLLGSSGAAAHPNQGNDQHGSPHRHPGDILANRTPEQCSQQAGEGRSREQYRRSKDTYPQARRAGRAMRHDGTGARLANASARAGARFRRRASHRLRPLPITTIVSTSSAAQITLSGMPP